MSKGIPQKYLDMIGKEFEFSGGLFSGKKSVEPAKYKILDVRFSSAFIINLKTRKAKCAAIEFLIKNDTMQRSRWTRPFPCPEVKYKES